MSDYQKSLTVEAKSRAILLPFIDRETDGKFIIMENGPLATAFQEQQGDVLFATRSGRPWSAELKAEEKHTGRLFLETWSNRNLEDVTNHHRHGSNPGWMLKLRSDLLFYHFLDLGVLYILPLFRLQRWAFGHGKTPGKIYKYGEHQQGKYTQLNDTWGRCVDVEDLTALDFVKVFYPLQVEMFPDRTGRIADATQPETP